MMRSRPSNGWHRTRNGEAGAAVRITRESPLIGITTYGRQSDGHPPHLRGMFRAPAAYVDAVARGGGIPVLLPPATGDVLRAVRRLLDTLDGFVLTGGGDVSPALYGAVPHERVYGVDDDRDAFELALVRACLRAAKPILGICRGIQVFNVALGGDLIQHLPDARPEGLDHACFPAPPKAHEVVLASSSLLASALQAVSFEVTSWHHQAIGRLAEEWSAVGHAGDGVVEAVEMSSHPWCVAVQWHPEMDADRVPVQQRLFTQFVEAARKAARG
jgi:putative glutamine amidotransferase